MRRIRTAGIGIGLALSASAGFAQQSEAPAARFVRVQAVDGSGNARGQVTPADGTAPAVIRPPAGAAIAMPRPLPGPSVTEIRTAPAASIVPPAAATTTPILNGTPVAAPSVVPCDPLLGSAPAVCPDLDAPLYGGPTDTLTTPQRFQLRSDLLLWFIRSGHLPPLVTGSSLPFSGILGQGDTRVLYGDSNENTYHVGGNFGGVYWLGGRQVWGVDGNIFFLGRNGTQFTATTADAPVIARPFFNLNAGTPFSEIVGAAGLATGAVAVNMETMMWGADINLRRYLCSTPCARLDGFLGFRYLNMSEELTITENFARTPDSPTSVGVPTAISGTVIDSFRTDNHFYGPQIGLTGEVRRGRWFLEGRGSIAMGTVVQTAQIGGSQSILLNTGAVTANSGGLYALPEANIGTFTQHKFGVVPEVGIKLGFHVTPHLRLAVGYNFLYLNSVLRPGDQIDTGLDVTRIPNFPLPGNPTRLATVRPAPTLRDSDVFAQGISFSLQWNW